MFSLFSKFECECVCVGGVLCVCSKTCRKVENKKFII